jgi:hypothetical protein
VTALATLTLAVTVMMPQTIWKAVTGFYGTRQVAFQRICEARYMGDRIAFVQVRIRGRRHDAALHLFSRETGWVVMWSDGRVNPKIGSSTRPLVAAEVTRLKAKCLAP